MTPSFLPPSPFVLPLSSSGRGTPGWGIRPFRGTLPGTSLSAQETGPKDRCDRVPTGFGYSLDTRVRTVVSYTSESPL